MADESEVALPPLVVDLDGTLTLTDTLAESVLQVVKHNVADIVRLPLWLLGGRAGFKHQVAARSRISAEALPYRRELVEYLRAEKKKGRRLVLATAAHESVAAAVATHFGVFDDIIASDRLHNLKGAAKLRAIREKIGEPFVYAGDSAADLAIWKGASGAVLAGASPAVARAVRRSIPIEREMPSEKQGFAVWLRAFRVHQWLKNLLVFVPLLTAFTFDRQHLTASALAFLAFCLTASATYIFNDLLDLEADRAHPRKRARPFASGQLSATTGIAAAVVALSAGAALALAVSQAFLLILVFYFALTSLYSLVLKKHVLVDVLALSVLYTVRIVGGAVAAVITVSAWLLAFSAFVFVSLALLKRCSELVSMASSGEDTTRGRDYRVTDLTVLWPLGVGSGLSAVVVFGLFINAPETQTRYATPSLLWAVALGLIYWLARVWIKAARGEMHDDPVVFALRDFGSRVTVLAILGATLAAKFVQLG